MQRITIPLPDDGWITIQVEALDQIEQVLEQSLTPVTPAIQSHIDQTYGTLNARRAKTTSAASAQTAIKTLSAQADQMEANLNTLLGQNPSAAVTLLAQNQLAMITALRRITTVLLREIKD